jgi:hypothetical protein
MAVELRRWSSLQQFVLLGLLVASSGCSSGKPARVASASVDPDAAAARALELWDGNADGAVDKEEAAAKCPPLVGALPAFDANGDGKITAEEFAGHIKSASSVASITSVYCTVLQNGRPLSGATVKLRPVAMYGDELPPAEGTTNADGVAQPSIGADNLPENLASRPLLYPGLYHVEITHPTTSLPAKYNEATELGCEVDPSSRDGASAKFDLKPN